MAKPETAIVNKIMLWLEADGGWWFNVHGGPYQKAGVPDILGCYNGIFIAIEVKCPGNEPTTLQSKTMQEIKESGGHVGVAYNVQDALRIRDKGSE